MCILACMHVICVHYVFYMYVYIYICRYMYGLYKSHTYTYIYIYIHTYIHFYEQLELLSNHRQHKQTSLTQRIQTSDVGS